MTSSCTSMASEVFQWNGADVSNEGKQEKIKEELRKKAEAEEKEFDESQFESQLPIDSLEMFENIAFLMHKHGDPEQPKDINEWLEQFETFDIYEILPEILEMWNLENKQKSTPKKGKGK